MQKHAHLCAAQRRGGEERGREKMVAAVDGGVSEQGRMGRRRAGKTCTALLAYRTEEERRLARIKRDLFFALPSGLHSPPLHSTLLLHFVRPSTRRQVVLFVNDDLIISMTRITERGQ